MDTFYEQLDCVFQTHDIQKIEEFFLTSNSSSEPVERVLILNEYIGFLRETSQCEKGKQVVKELLELSHQLGIDESVEFGTILLNLATFLRVCKDYTQSQNYYEKVKDLYTSLDTTDYRLASFYNNYGLFLLETNQLDQAKEQLEMALSCIQNKNDYAEITTTYTNLGQICFRMNEIEQGIDYMIKGVSTFENNHLTQDTHYAASLAGLGQAYFYKKDYENSYQCFFKACKEIEKNYGKDCENYRISKANLDYIEKLLNKNISGLELSRKYYEAFGKEMIENKFADYANRIAVGSVGKGSERLQLDDSYSQDHDFGLGFCLFLTKEDYEAIGIQLQQEYDALPDTYLGYTKVNTKDQRFGVYEIDDFFIQHIGYSSLPATLKEWDSIDSISLLNVTNGKIFKDDCKVFTNKQNQFKKYPDSVKYYKLGYALFRAGQAGQYNYFRMKQREDSLSMYQCKNEFIQAVIDIVYLLNDAYKPVYKWQFRMMNSFEKCKEICENLQKCILNFDESDIEKICIQIVEELNKEGISNSLDSFLVNQKDEVWKHVSMKL